MLLCFFKNHPQTSFNLYQLIPNDFLYKSNHNSSKMKMLPFAEPSFFESLPRIFFRMPRVVLNQRAKFESDELFKKLSRECEVGWPGDAGQCPVDNVQ